MELVEHALRILSVIGLAFSLALWGAGYWRLSARAQCRWLKPLPLFDAQRHAVAEPKTSLLCDLFGSEIRTSWESAIGRTTDDTGYRLLFVCGGGKKSN